MRKRDTSSETNWETLVGFFPSTWEELAQEPEANRRLRGFPSVEALMRTLLLPVARGYSFRETAVRARLAGLGQVSDVAFLKRLRNAEGWFHRLCVALLQKQAVPRLPRDKQLAVRLVDSTLGKEPGQTGSLWRIHYSFCVPEFCCDTFRLPPTKGIGTGDALTQFPIAPGDHLIADRGYCHGAGSEPVVKNGGALLVRLNTQTLPLFTPHGRRLALVRRLAKLQTAGQVGEWAVVVRGPTLRIAGRLCAIRKTEEAIEQAEKRLRRRASKKGEELRAATLEYAKYVIVFTTFATRTFSAAEVLQWYRLRWQVERLFKRLKSLAQLGHLPKTDERSTRAWLYGKRFVALLTDRLIHQGQVFSPCGPTTAARLPANPLAGVCLCASPNPASYRTRRTVALRSPVLESDCPRFNRASSATSNAS